VVHKTNNNNKNKKNVEADSFSLTLPTCSCIRVQIKGIVTQEYVQKQDGSTDLNVKNKTKYEMDCKKRNDICPDSSVFILSTPFKQGAEMEL